MSEQFNTIVVGLGAMGSSALYQLARRHVKVLGIDRFSPPHTFGSTHGDTRITRQAIGEGSHYTPLSLRSYEIFRELEGKTGADLLTVTGGLILGSESEAGRASINHVSGFLDNTIAAARKYDIKHDLLSAAELRSRFKQFNVADDEIAYYEYEAAFLRPERVVGCHIDVARSLGAEVHTGETLESFEETSGGVEVKTDGGTYLCQRLVLTVGPWLPETILPAHSSLDTGSLFNVHRQVLYWFDIEPSYDWFTIGNFPIFIWQLKGNENGIYGFPAVDGPAGGFKIASEDYSVTVTPGSVDRSVSSEETDSMFERKVAPFFPLAGSRCVKSAVCMYTVTPDSGFVIDWLPGSASQRVVVCSPCSGHGFKHSAAIGEAVAQMVTTGETTLDMSQFTLSRFDSHAGLKS